MTVNYRLSCGSRPSSNTRASERNGGAAVGYRRGFVEAQAQAKAMPFPATGQAMLVAHERYSRLAIALSQASLKADPVAAVRAARLDPLPHAALHHILGKHDNTPGKYLGFPTPAKTFNTSHCKSESKPTSNPA